MLTRSRRGILVGLFLVSAGLVSTYIHRAAARRSVSVVNGELNERVFTRCTVVPRAGVAKVRPLVSGRVASVLVREGDSIQIGQLLAEIESSSFSYEVQRREAERDAMAQNELLVSRGASSDERAALAAEVRVAQEDANNAARHAERMAQMHGRQATSDSDNEGAAHEAAAARARYEAAVARLRARTSGRIEEVRGASSRTKASAAAVQQAQRDLESTRITAPIAGVVLARHVDAGDTVFSLVDAPALFELADASSTEVLCELEEADATRLASPVRAEIASANGTVGRGHLARMAPLCERRSLLVDPASVRAEGLVRRSWVEWDTPDPGLPIGARLDVTLVLPPHRVAALVPRNAVRIRDGVAVVDLVRHFFSEERPVRLGIADKDVVEVEGVQLGDKVWVEP